MSTRPIEKLLRRASRAPSPSWLHGLLMQRNEDTVKSKLQPIKHRVERTMFPPL